MEVRARSVPFASMMPADAAFTGITMRSVSRKMRLSSSRASLYSLTGFGQTGSPNVIPRPSISTADGFRNSSPALFAFTCHFGVIMTWTVTFVPGAVFPAGYSREIGGGGMLFISNTVLCARAMLTNIHKRTHDFKRFCIQKIAKFIFVCFSVFLFIDLGRVAGTFLNTFRVWLFKCI